MFSKKDLFIFDVDGTLVDAYPAIVSSFNFTMRRLGYPERPAAVIRAAVGAGDVFLLKPFVPGEDLNQAVRIYRRHHREALKKHARWMPHARTLLSCLKKKKIKMAVASNRPTEFTRIILRTLRGEVFFDKVLCADRLPYRKPHPLILNTIVRALGVPKSDAVYVGDMVIDIRTGKRAGIETVAIGTGSHSYSTLKRSDPEYLFKDLRVLKNSCRKFCVPKPDSRPAGSRLT